MRLALVVLILLLSSPLVSSSSYYAVVRSDGPASDVVNAANFAANMKARAGVSFTGVTEDDLEYADDDSIYVWFDGTSARIEYALGMEDVRDTAETYLADQGFSVTTEVLDGEGTPARVDVVPEEPIDDTRDAILLAADDELSDGNAPEDVVSQDETERVDEGEKVPEPPMGAERPNVLVRAWHWFVGLFS